MPANRFTYLNSLIKWRVQFGVTLLYLLFGYDINHLLIAHNIEAMVWPGSGLALAWLLIGGRHYIWTIWLGTLLLNILFGQSLWSVYGRTLAISIEAFSGAWLLTGNHRPLLYLHTLRDYLRLIAFGDGIASIAGAL